jgi:hypothetical protein
MTVIRARLAAAAPLAALILAGAAGCGPDFDPYGRLIGLRVLAVRSDPPNPAAGETAMLSAVIDPPEMAAQLRHVWSWCPVPRPGGVGVSDCLFTPEALTEAAMLPPGVLPPTNLGEGETVAFMHGVQPEQLQPFCRSNEMQPFGADCGVGFPVKVGLTVTALDGSDEIESVWSLLLPVESGAPVNRNPAINGFVAVIDGVEVPLTADPDPLLVLPRDEETVIRAVLPDGVIETYTDKDPDSNPETPDVLEGAPERLFLSWFVQSGETDDERTGTNYGQGYTIPIPDALALARENKWAPALVRKYPGETARLVVVIRDNRGGVGSRAATVRLEGGP